MWWVKDVNSERGIYHLNTMRRREGVGGGNYKYINAKNHETLHCSQGGVSLSIQLLANLNAMLNVYFCLYQH